MSGYLPPSREVESESLARLGIAVRRAKDANHVVQQLVVSVELLIDLLQPLPEGVEKLRERDSGLDLGGGELPHASGRGDARLEFIKPSDHILQLVEHLRSLIDDYREVKS